MVLSLLITNNMKSNYTETHKKSGIGSFYDSELYSGDGWSDRTWEIEKHILSKILKGRKKSKILDFATGTGRIAKFLEDSGFKNITGVDSSEEMLKPAREKLKKTNLVCTDITKSKNKLANKNGVFDTIIAFRFFLNAEERLRNNVLKSLNKLIKKDGVLIINIHANKNSIFKLCKYFPKNFGRRDRVLSLEETRKLLERNGFTIKKKYSYGFIPHKKSLSLLSFKKWIFLEKLLVSRFFIFGTHFILVCQKIKKDE